MMRRAILAGSILVALASPAPGQEGGIPRLADHEFVPVPAIDEPFLNTFVQTKVSFAHTFDSALRVYSPRDSTLLGLANVRQAFTSLGFWYQQRVQDWLVVQTEIGFLGRLGTDTNSLVANGITGALSYQIGWMMKVARTESTLLSGSLSLGRTAATFVDPLGWAYSIVSGRNAPLVASRRSLRGKGGLHGAWALSRRFGLLGAVHASYGEAFDRKGTNGWHTESRLALSYNARQDIGIPLGIAATGGRYGNDVNSDAGGDTWFWNLRIAAIGRSDFSLGLQSGMTFFDIGANAGRLRIFESAIDMRYYY